MFLMSEDCSLSDRNLMCVRSGVGSFISLCRPWEEAMEPLLAAQSARSFSNIFEWARAQ